MIERTIHFQNGRRGQKLLREGVPPPVRHSGRLPRITRLLALAHKLEEYLRTGQVKDQVELAALGRVTRARISQIMNLLNLAPSIQEEILFLPVTVSGRDPIHLALLQPIARTHNWNRQRELWASLLASIA
jgi:hypothetical protein